MIHSTVAFDTLYFRTLSKELPYVMFLLKPAAVLFYKMSTGAITNKQKYHTQVYGSQPTKSRHSDQMILPKMCAEFIIRASF